MSTSTLDPNIADPHVAGKPQQVSPQREEKAGFLPFVLRQIPTLIVMVSLAAVGLYGHSTHWKLPRFAELTGGQAPVPDDWCEDHGVPESNCVECNPDLFPAGPDYGWCAEHGVHNCPLHHPSVAQLKESPEISEAEFGRAEHALSLRDRRHNNAACKVYQRRIQFASIESVQQAGVDVELVERQPVSEWVSGNGEITYDTTRLANLSSRVSGTAGRVFKNIGDSVQEGDILAVVDSMEVGRLKSDLVKALVAEELARKNFDRLSGITTGAVPGKQILEIEAALAQAEAEVLSTEQALANLGLRADVSALRGLTKRVVNERLRFLGLPQDLSRQFESQTTTANLIPIRSPMNGIIVKREVVIGEAVDSSRVLFQVADPSRMWLMLNIPIEQASLLSIGQSVRFRPNGSQDEIAGTLNWISTAVDQRTRMVKVRANLENDTGRLRDETFGTGQVILREDPDAIVVPSSAVHWEGCCHVVFVRDKEFFASPESPKVFHVRSVRMGAKNGNRTEIIAGVLPGEVVVTKGSDVLRSQLLKNNLGEGCCAE